jgi:hypothetical protein
MVKEIVFTKTTKENVLNETERNTGKSLRQYTERGIIACGS